MPLPVTRHHENRDEGCRPRCRSGKREQGNVSPGQTRPDHRSIASPWSEPHRQDDPGNEQPNVQPGDGKEMCHARGDECLAQRGWEIVAPSQDECLDDTGTGTIQRANAFGDHKTNRKSPSAIETDLSGMRHAEHAVSAIGTHGDEQRARWDPCRQAEDQVAVARLRRVPDHGAGT